MRYVVGAVLGLALAITGEALWKRFLRWWFYV